MKEAGYVYILTNPSFKEDWNTAPYQDLVQKSSSKENTLVVMGIQVEEGGIISREVLINRQ